MIQKIMPFIGGSDGHYSNRRKETAIMAENLSVPAGLIFFTRVYLYFQPILPVKMQRREIWHRIRSKGSIN